MDKILGISIDDFYWNLKFGKSKKRISVLELRADLNKYIKAPIFFLSTGRCGTKWMSNLMENNKQLMVLHSPNPTLAIQSKLVYNALDSQNLDKQDIHEFIKEIFLAARESYLRYSYKTEKRFVETNNYITFFAPILAHIFPDAKFIHLYRHPGEFVRSGLRRNYYADGNSDDLKRIDASSDSMQWNNYTRIEKTAWLWNATNLFIEKFKEDIPERVFDFNFNELNLENVEKLLDFLNIKIPQGRISGLLNKKVNIQRSGDIETYENWEEKDKEQLRSICLDLATKYQYKV